MAASHIGDPDHGKKRFVPPVPIGPNETFPSTPYRLKQAVADYNKNTVPKVNSILPLAYPRAKKIK